MVNPVEKQEACGGSPLKEIRLFLGMTQAQFAALIGSSETTVRRREKGSGVGLDWPEIVALERALLAHGKHLSDFPSRTPETQNA